MQSFVVAVDGGWSDWSQWSHCTKNVIGRQMRTRQCDNPKPQFGGKLCTGANATAMRGCQNISRCRQGISKLLKKNFVYPTPQGFLMISTVQSLLKANFSAALLFIGLFTRRYWGGHRSFDATRETRDCRCYLGKICRISKVHDWHLILQSSRHRLLNCLELI